MFISNVPSRGTLLNYKAEQSLLLMGAAFVLLSLSGAYFRYISFQRPLRNPNFVVE